jgi:hypothetical protein
MRKLTQGEIARKLIATPLIGEETPDDLVGLALDRSIARGGRTKPTARDVRLLTLYGITEAERAKILEYQGGGCAACGEKRPLNVDHDHRTGVVRGLLCWRCNKMVAYLRDSAALADAAALYLRTHPAACALRRPVLGRVGRVTRRWRTKCERRDRMRVVAGMLAALGFSVPRSVSRWILPS